MSDRTPNIKDVLLAVEKLGYDLRTEMGQLRIDIMARLDRHQDALTAMREDIGVNFDRADRAVDAMKGLRTEVDHLSSEVSGIERQVQRLQSEMRQLRGEA